MTAFTVKAIDEMQAHFHGAVKLAAAELGIESFGLQVLDFPPGFTDYPEHDHAEDGQEEVYVVLRGSGEFEVDGERVSLDPGRMLRVAPEAKRRLEPGADGIRILAIGSTVEGRYERPADFQLSHAR